MFVRFSRYRFKEDRIEEGVHILRAHAKAVRGAPGCEGVWLGQGQHPATEVVLLAIFRDESSLRSFEGRLRSDPSLGSDAFSLMRLTTAPPELAPYEVLDAR